jgi:hypothetical protein
MLLVNKLTEPGGIKKISLYPDIVRIETRDGGDILYRLIPNLVHFVPTGNNGDKEVEHEAIQM